MFEFVNTHGFVGFLKFCCLARSIGISFRLRSGLDIVLWLLKVLSFVLTLLDLGLIGFEVGTFNIVVLWV